MAGRAWRYAGQEVIEPSALLLDLDGVVVLEAEGRTARAAELFLLHPELAVSLRRAAGVVLFLTHRSRREADLILRGAGLEEWLDERCLTAEDIFRSAIRHGRFRELAAGGLRKSLVLPEIWKRFGIAAEELCFVDDRRENLDDMLRAGVGLGMLAPSALGDDRILTFAIDEVLECLSARSRRCIEEIKPPPEIRELSPRWQAIEQWCCTGLTTRNKARGLFSAGRRLGRGMRRLVAGQG